MKTSNKYVVKPELFSDIYLARVESVSDPLQLGRVKLLIPQVLGTAISNWASPVSYGMPVARGQLIYASFIGGDRNKPIYFGQAQKNLSANYFLSPSSDTTGSTDTANINSILALGAMVMLTPGTFYVNRNISIPSNSFVRGSGQGVTNIIPGSGWSGSTMFTMAGQFSGISGLRFYGGSGTRSSNPSANCITVTNTASSWSATDLYTDHTNGISILCNPSTGSHGTIRSIKSEHPGGGISIDNGTGGSITAEINVSDIDIQNCETSEVIFLSAVTDILVSTVNGSIKSGTALNCITVQGSCQTCQLTGLDVGGGTGTGVMVLQQGGSNSPTDIIVSGKLQGGNIGLVVNDSTARCQFMSVQSTRNQTDGIQVNSTGAFLAFMAPMMNNNNQSSVTAYDFNVTSTGHVLIDGPAYVSGGVTANLNITSASNHVTEANPTSSRTTSGNPPNGW